MKTQAENKRESKTEKNTCAMSQEFKNLNTFTSFSNLFQFFKDNWTLNLILNDYVSQSSPQNPSRRLKTPTNGK